MLIIWFHFVLFPMTFTRTRAPQRRKYVISHITNEWVYEMFYKLWALLTKYVGAFWVIKPNNKTVAGYVFKANNIYLVVRLELSILYRFCNYLIYVIHFLQFKNKYKTKDIIFLCKLLCTNFTNQMWNENIGGRKA